MSERRHLSDAELVDLCLGESPAGEDVARIDADARDGDPRDRLLEHLADCQVCAERRRRLQSMLEMVAASPVPERGEDYGARVWARIEPEIAGASSDLAVPSAPDEGPGRIGRLLELVAPRRLAWAAAIAAMVVAAFLIGRHGAGPGGVQPAASAGDDEARERILLVALTEHLQRTQMVLVELSNAEAEGGLDIRDEKARASDLVGANRLYRRTATRVGNRTVAGLLEELERILVEIANSPDEVGADDLETIRRRIEDQGILFKVRVLSTRARGGGASPGTTPGSVESAPPTASPSST